MLTTDPVYALLQGVAVNDNNNLIHKVIQIEKLEIFAKNKLNRISFQYKYNQLLKQVYVLWLLRKLYVFKGFWLRDIYVV